MKARSSVQKINAYALQPGSREDKIRLDLNENAWGCSPKVVNALQNIGKSNISFYPDYQEFFSRLSKVYDIPGNNLLITNGADDGIRAVMQTFVETDEEVLLADPSFGMIHIHASVVGAQVHPILYETDFSFPIRPFLEAIRPSTRLIAIVRPDSPMGTVISRADLIRILEAAPYSVVLLDETYAQFLGDTCLELIHEFPNLVILHSFSKAYGLAGLRLGIIASDAENILQIGKVNPPFGVNTLAVLAGIAALEDLDYLQQVIQNMKQEKQWLITSLEKLDFQVRDSAANFILLNTGDHAVHIHQELLKKHILVKNLNHLPLLKGYFRIAVGTRRENTILLEALRDIKASL